MPLQNPTEDAGQAPPSTTGLRAQLNHLIARHALFDVRITVHQLASVPLVSGEFSVRWRFKNTHKLRGKSRATIPEPGDRFGGDEVDPRTFASGSTLFSEKNLHVLKGDSRTTVHTTLQTLSYGSSASGSTSFSDENTRTRRRADPADGLTTSGDPSTASTDPQPHSNASVFDADAREESSAARGQTPWLPLREHAVSWDQPLSAVVQMSIDRTTHRLLPHPFKLTVLQRAAGDFGTVELDLAEYADSGTVTRRYLLQGSKTNATLRLSVRVTPAPTSAPPCAFLAPPLPHGEILAGVATLLTAHADVFRTRPHALDLYAPAPLPAPAPPGTPPFDVRALPRVYGPRPTETLIDALFNPTPVRDARLVGPFTRLVRAEAAPSIAPSTASSSSTTTTTSTSAASLRSVSTHGSGAGASARSLAPTEGTHSHWWNRARSRSRSRSRSRVGVAAS
ncbi:hypothetical protein B0H15DRAFT_777091 [Mycena belliarum]|uniref:C2 NT-type domain-containing protein n=1 Tax=Mycena belliarum TaxID=1033014 RepID=A0AAD6U9D4_9AGAR|nr:hypothetical protein B0H15DRAFT_777091 [Mycena belliae]